MLGVVIAQLALVLIISFAINKISATLATVLFFAYAALTGVTFAFIFELYTTQSIFTTFLITSGDVRRPRLLRRGDQDGPLEGRDDRLRGADRADHRDRGQHLRRQLTLYWITTYAGVIIFAALTAYDMQKLKQIGEQGVGGEQESKLAVFGAPLALPRLHQHVPVPAADLRPAALSRALRLLVIWPGAG